MLDVRVSLPVRPGVELSQLLWGPSRQRACCPPTAVLQGERGSCLEKTGNQEGVWGPGPYSASPFPPAVGSPSPISFWEKEASSFQRCSDKSGFFHAIGKKFQEAGPGLLLGVLPHLRHSRPPGPGGGPGAVPTPPWELRPRPRSLSGPTECLLPVSAQCGRT